MAFPMVTGTLSAARMRERASVKRASTNLHAGHLFDRERGGGVEVILRCEIQHAAAGDTQRNQAKFDDETLGHDKRHG